MEQREKALIPLMGGAAVAAGTTPLYPPFKGGQGANLAVVPSGAWGSEQEEVQMRLWEEMAKNRTLGIELAWANDLIRAAAEQKKAMRRVRRAALKLLGWLGVGLVCGFMAMACWFMAPRWTCIAPAVLTGLALWKAGEEV